MQFPRHEDPIADLFIILLYFVVFDGSILFVWGLFKLVEWVYDRVYWMKWFNNQ